MNILTASNHEVGWHGLLMHVSNGYRRAIRLVQVTILIWRQNSMIIPITLKILLWILQWLAWQILWILWNQVVMELRDLEISLDVGWFQLHLSFQRVDRFLTGLAIVFIPLNHHHLPRTSRYDWRQLSTILDLGIVIVRHRDWIIVHVPHRKLLVEFGTHKGFFWLTPFIMVYDLLPLLNLGEGGVLASLGLHVVRDLSRFSWE